MLEVPLDLIFKTLQTMFTTHFPVTREKAASCDNKAKPLIYYYHIEPSIPPSALKKCEHGTRTLKLTAQKPQHEHETRAESKGKSRTSCELDELEGGAASDDICWKNFRQ